jgi:excisionase family DNA binding protein
MKLLTTKEAAERLGVGYVRVNQFIKEGRLPAQKYGRDYMIKESDLKLVEDRKPGRPPKQASKKTKAKG